MHMLIKYETHASGTAPSRVHWDDRLGMRHTRWSDNGLEYDQNGPRQTLVDWIKGAGGVSTTFDFPTKGILQEAVKNTEYWRLIDPGKHPLCCSLPVSLHTKLPAATVTACSCYCNCATVCLSQVDKRTPCDCRCIHTDG